MSSLNLKNAEQQTGMSNNSSAKDTRAIFENAENHEPPAKAQQQIPTIVEQPPTPSSENEPPPLPPRPPHRSPQPSPKSPHSDFNKALPPEPVPAFDNISDSESISEQASPGREALSIKDLMSYMSRVGKKGIHKEYDELRSLPLSGIFESTM